jgi:hypothetical protein
MRQNSLVDGAVEFDGALDQLREAAGALQAEAGCHAAAPEVGIDQQHAPAARCKHRCEVGRHEGLAGAGRGARNHDPVVQRARHCELQRGAQPPQSLERWIVRMSHRQQVHAGLAVEHGAVEMALLVAQRDGAVHVQAGVGFDLRRAGNGVAP